MRLLIIAHDLPYPANHGGKVDMWNRILGLSQNGVEIFLITWETNPLDKNQVEVLNKTVNKYKVLKKRKNPLYVLNIFYPTHVMSRTVNRREYNKLKKEIQEFNPDKIFLDGIHGGILAFQLSKELGKPIVYRSHNVEYKYVKQLFKAERNFVKKIISLTNIFKTYFFEKKLRKKAYLTLDISKSDKNIWNDQSEVLYPYLNLNNNMATTSSEKVNVNEGIDILYVGNLYTPNNVFGLKWFITKCYPLLGNEFSIVIAGSNPNNEIISLCKEYGIKLKKNPLDVIDLYKSAKLLINPVFHGSGVNIKIIEMLATGKPVITTSVGSRGVDENLKPFLNISDSHIEFVNNIKKNINKGISSEQIAAIKKYYGLSENIDKLLKLLKRIEV